MRKLPGKTLDRDVRSSILLPGLTTLALAGLLLNGCTPKSEETTGDLPDKKEDTHNQVDPDGDGKPATEPLGEHTHDTKLEFRPQPKPIIAGQPTIWNFKVIDIKAKKGVADFKLTHEKVMHLIVVSKDLTWFNHLHPDPIGYGALTLSVTLPRAGDYKLYADYVPLLQGGLKMQEGEHEVAQKEFDVSPSPDAKGVAPFGRVAKLEADKPNGAWITKTVASHPESEPDSPPQGQYQVALMPMPTPIIAGEDVMMHFQVRDVNGKPLKDLQPYLGAMGHAVILSEDSTIYLHTHPMEGGGEHDMNNMTADAPPAAPPTSGGPDVMFHTNFPAPGMYKIWGQFKHKDAIITAPFVFKVEPAKKGAKPAAAHDHKM